LKRASEADGAALGFRRLHLVEGLVVGEPFGVVVDGIVVGDRDRAPGGGEQGRHDVVVAVGGDGDTAAAGPLDE
jgi:hypothetical protein